MDSIRLKVTNQTKHIAKPVEFKSGFDEQEKSKIAKASKDFESLLSSMMIKSMTKSTGGLLGGGEYGGEVFDMIFTQQLAEQMTNSSGYGIAEKIYRSVTGEQLPDSGIKALQHRPVQFHGDIKKSAEGVPGVQPSNSSLKRLHRFDPIINDAARRHGVSPNLVRSIILAESAAKERAVSKANAKGLMQLMDATAKDMGVNNSFDPKQNIEGGTKYISKMLQKYGGNVKHALAAYNAGPANVDKYNGIPPFQETQNYVPRVLGYLKHLEDGSA